tara:strand:- start:1380 stop:1490 length:111 start_codon:yes stop_codon:yes gene_type:complete
MFARVCLEKFFSDLRQANAKHAGFCNGATFMIDTGE